MITIIKRIKDGDREFKNTERRLMPALLIESASATVLNLTSTFIMGNISSVVLAGVGQGNSITLPFIWGLSALSAGGGVNVANKIGAGNPLEARKFAAQSLLSGIVLSFISSFSLFLFRDQIMNALFAASGAETVAATIDYFYFSILAAPFWFIFYQTAAIFRSCRNSTVPMIINVTMNILSILFSRLFILGGLGIPPLGAVGSGLAIFVSVGIGAIMSLIMLVTIESEARIRSIKDFLPDIPKIIKVNKVGLPCLAESMLVCASRLIMQIIAASLGVATISAMQIMSTSNALFTIYLESMFSIAVPIVALAIGANGKRRAVEAMEYLAAKSRVISVATGVLYALLNIPLVSLLTNNPETFYIAVILNFILAATNILFGSPSAIYNYGSRGAFDVKYPMVVSGLSAFLSRVVLMYLMVYVFKMGFISAAVPLAFEWGIRSLLYYRRFKTGKWLRFVPAECGE